MFSASTTVMMESSCTPVHNTASPEGAKGTTSGDGQWTETAGFKSMWTYAGVRGGEHNEIMDQDMCLMKFPAMCGSKCGKRCRHYDRAV